MPKLTRRLGVLAALASLLVIAAVAAIAVAGGGPKTDKAQASFTATKASTKERTCTGQDGTYREAREVFKGTVSGHARLSGDLVLRTHSLIDRTTGDGSTDGHVWVRKAGGGPVLAYGKLVAVNSRRGVLEGFISGKLAKSGGARVWANFSATFNADGTQVTGKLGDGGGANTAVIQTGRCSGGDAPGHARKPAKTPQPEQVKHPEQS